MLLERIDSVSDDILENSFIFVHAPPPCLLHVKLCIFRICVSFSFEVLSKDLLVRERHFCVIQREQHMLLTVQSKVLIENLLLSQSGTSAIFYKTPKFFTHIHKSPPLSPFLSQLNPVHKLISVYKWSLPFRFSD